MQKEMISARQMICIIVMFLFGNSVIIGVSSEAGQDSWLSVLLAPVMVMPMILVYARIIRLYPEKDLFEIIEILFGKTAGKIIIILMAWFAIQVGALVLRSFSEFIQIVFMPETPQLPIVISMMLVVFYLAYSGVETMGKWSIAMLAVIVFVVVFTTVLSLNIMDFTNITPFFEHSFKTVASGAYMLFTIPFAETVLFLGLANSMRQKDNPYKTYIYATLIGTAILLVVILRNLFVLGAAMVNAEYFPSYVAVRVINIGDFMARIEGSIAVNFILSGIIKITVCLLVATQGTARLFRLENHRHILLPMSLLVIALSVIIYKNAMELFDYIKIYEYYFIPFEIIIPVLIWIAAEIKCRRNRSSKVKEITF